jgi:hypothetical protein
VKNYLGRIKVISEFILGREFNKHHAYPTLPEANTIFADFDAVAQAINKKYPDSVESQKALYVAIVAMVRTQQLSAVTDDTIKKYQEKLKELCDLSNDNYAESMPTRNMAKNGVNITWDLILTRRDEYLMDTRPLTSCTMSSP